MAGFRQSRNDSATIFDECPVGGIDAVLTVRGCGYLNDFDAGLLKAFDNEMVFLLGLAWVDGGIGVIGVNFKVVCEEFSIGDDNS